MKNKGKESYSSQLIESGKWFIIVGTLVLSFISVFFDIQKHTLGYDPLSVKLYEDDWLDVDSWSFLHVIFFGMIPAYLLPNHVILFFVFGCLWEVVEYSLASTLQNYSMKGVWEERLKNVFNDLVFNTIGLVLGLLLRGKKKEISGTVMKVVRFICVEGSIWLFFIWICAMQYQFEFNRSFIYGCLCYLAVLMPRTLFQSFLLHVFSWKTVFLRNILLCSVIAFGFVLYVIVGRLSEYGVEKFGYKAPIIPSIDHTIPYNQWMWIPYLSFFPWGFFVGLTSGSTMIYISMAIWISHFSSLAFYYVFPMEMERQSIESLGYGVMADVGKFVYEFDRPFNTLPSLHACITTILLLGNSSGTFKAPIMLLCWFTILLSTLMTKQHTFLDAVTGVLLGVVSYLLSIWILREKVRKQNKQKSKRE